MEVPRLGVKAELQLLTYATTTATIDCFFFWTFVYLGLYPQHMEVPRLGVESEL